MTEENNQETNSTQSTQVSVDTQETVSGVDLSFDLGTDESNEDTNTGVEGDKSKNKKDNKETPTSKPAFDKTGDPGMDLAMGWFSNLGYGPDDEVVRMAYEGDFRLLRAELSGRDDAHGWQEYVAIAEQYQKDSVAKEASRIVDIEKKVHEVVGGEKQWNDIYAWAKSNADDKQKIVFNKFIVEGDPTSASMCAEWLMNRYREATGTSFEPAKAVRDTPSDNSGASTYALNPRQYAEEVTKLAQKIGSQNVNQSPEYVELKKRRSAWRG